MDEFDIPLSEMEQQVTSRAREALLLRFGDDSHVRPGLPTAGSGQTAILESLQFTRSNLDRVEELLSEVIRIKGRTDRALAGAEAAYRDAWDEAVISARRKSNARGGDYYGAKEMEAIGNTQALDDLVEFRQVQRLRDVVEETFNLVRTAHRGLADLRQDHLTVLRAVQFETSLDR